MASTKLTDIIESGSGPRVFAGYIQRITTELSDFIQSGVVEDNHPELTEFLAGGGKTMDMPHWQDLDNTDANISTDAAPGDSDATPLNNAAADEVAIRCNRNQHWQVATLSGEMAGSDPYDAIAARVGDYWMREKQRTVIKICQGIMLDNANDSDDMRNDDSLPGVGSPAPENLFNAEGFLDTIQTMGDAGKTLVSCAMHSVVYNRLRKNDLIDFIPDSDGKFTIPTYQGLLVTVDDGMPAVSFSGNTRYSTYLFGRGFLSAGDGTPKNPLSSSVEELAGDGGGAELLHSRVKFAFHPRGFSFISGSLAGPSPTNAEFALAANWNRVTEYRKFARFAEYRTNG